MKELFKDALSVPPNTDTVLSACKKLHGELENEIYINILCAAGISRQKAEKQIAEARALTDPDFLKERLRRELSGFPYTHAGAKYEIRPKGVILHIAPSNAGAAGAYSVTEALLTGNCSILKLSSRDDGISEKLISMLTDFEPDLKKYIHIARVSSSDEGAIRKLVEAADAVSVWGGDGAVRSVRKLCPPEVDIIEWGHRISFCYAARDADGEALFRLAKEICDSEQLYCSSCQMIYLDTDDENDLMAFSGRFISILERAAAQQSDDVFKSAGRTLELKCAELDGKKVLKGRGCAVTVGTDSRLMPSLFSRCVEIKPLKREDISKTLRPYKNRLQTAALICKKEDEKELSTLLLNAGVLRVTRPENMGAASLAHDGEYSLRRYVRITSSDF